MTTKGMQPQGNKRVNPSDAVPPEQEKPPTQSITNVTLGGQPANTQFGELTVWLSRSFAPDWYADALADAQRDDASGRRREILFAVSLAESYLFEWVRDEVLGRDFSRLNQYFPPGEKRGVVEKWKDIPKQLAKDGLIGGAPDLGTKTWQEFRRFVDMRNGLLHARASRPETTGLPDEEMPVPRFADLEAIKAGEPTRIVSCLIEELTSATKTNMPPWLRRSLDDVRAG